MRVPSTTLAQKLTHPRGHRDNADLSSLDLSRNDLTERGLRELGEALKCSNVQTLDLSTLVIQENCTLASLKIDEHWRTCDLPIQQLKTATELDLSDKGLGDAGTIIVSRIIK